MGLLLRRRRLGVIGAAAVLCGVAMAPGDVIYAQAQGPPEVLDPAASCVSEQCHSDITNYKKLHWSDLPNACLDCHKSNSGGHDFSVTEGPKLCAQCHKESVDEFYSAKRLHYPLEDGCLDCHQVHGSDAGSMLFSDPEDGLCADCHDDLLEGEYQHEPASEGWCVECHNPHASPNWRLLRNPDIPSLCWDCHDDHGEAMQGAKFQHPAGDCTNCHNPHSERYPRMLPAKGRKLCAECHDDIVEDAEGAAVDHAAVLSGEECLNCHSPHGADYKPQLKDSLENLCLACHDRPLRSGRSVLIDMQSWLADNDNKHEPLTQGGCVQCHVPHGSDHFRMLKKSFPEGFYQKFQTSSYALCFSCHDKRVFTTKQTTSLTGFRDGSRNLHYLHVNRAEKGRTCRACHDFHAASNDHLIRERVRFGQWMLPLGFAAAATGGSCQPGCHPPVSYDREAAE